MNFVFIAKILLNFKMKNILHLIVLCTYKHVRKCTCIQN